MQIQPHDDAPVIFAGANAALRTERRQINRGAPPKFSRALLALALTYELQERAVGELDHAGNAPGVLIGTFDRNAPRRAVRLGVAGGAP